MAGRLDGKRILVPESRSLDLFCAMLEREGGLPVRCPLVAIHDVEDAGPVVAWLQRLVQGGMDDLFLSTGEGVRRLLGFAERAGMQPQVIAAMGATRIICRGPKPLRVLRTVGLASDLTAEPATTDGVIAAARALDFQGRTVGVQLYPQGPETLTDFLVAAGARPDPVLCYAYASDVEEAQVASAIEAIIAGDVDLIAFTSAPQVRRLASVARKQERMDALTRAFDTVVLAAVGPVCAVAVEKAGWRVAVMPPENFHLKPFVGEIARALGG